MISATDLSRLRQLRHLFSYALLSISITVEEQALIATHYLSINKHEELKIKIADIQEQIIRRCAGGSSCDILRHLKIELVEAKEGAAEHLVTAHEALRPIHTEMDKCRLLGSDESVAKLNELQAAMASASKRR
ncbi:hypothetical protein HBH56_158070 [Parastagonospora nodorum]|uniref:Uncharacterized protein n=1 Tax=Phaeosphaeria nodorum (strain SN15 / ATCC MYA-4574 / FGSC 10173) TaxID=321614 RepID=A0A7U2HZ93_PHANO|nr:hypothetical protein HBH56_158070 [Parastagonospora nodorum]QRC97410.1 hypothetical protein JI435_434900 [Parastagonospora nodorum SN15]KAH3922938.1 hypothetical protein HBH54_216660 [Parastagonospora nodorum]KAH3973525.1 hypothetical protein HBH51_097030 [Parastagonospora nodorum]KAH4002412.1 hypothetical protein HBI10_073370 [Parastagonospora nodorum]